MASHFAVQRAPTGVGSSAGGDEVLAWVVARRSAAGGRRDVSLIFFFSFYSFRVSFYFGLMSDFMGFCVVKAAKFIAKQIGPRKVCKWP